MLDTVPWVKVREIDEIVLVRPDNVCGLGRRVVEALIQFLDFDIHSRVRADLGEPGLSSLNLSHLPDVVPFICPRIPRLGKAMRQLALGEVNLEDHREEGLIMRH